MLAVVAVEEVALGVLLFLVVLVALVAVGRVALLPQVE